MRQSKKEVTKMPNNMPDKIFIPAAACLIFLMGLSTINVNMARANDPVAAAKARIVKRLSQIVYLKSKGIVGENNRGYLELIRPARQYEGLVREENRDRQIIYSYIARRQGVSVSFVEKLRAEQIRKRAARGQWLQDQEGRWYQKK